MDFRDLFGIRKEEQQPQWTPIPSATDRATPPPLPLRKDEVENEARMNAINNTLKNWDAAMKLREAMQQPVQDNSPQAQNLRQAEEDLQQAKEEDAQSGSEGYEKKEDGIFSRMANWGSSVGEYLFGKSTPEEEAAERAEEERIAAEKADKGVIGYYYDKLMGTRTPEEEAKIAADKERMGWLGYYGKKANDTLETMARSPFSKFVDPTTLLGGQQSMVEDIDADYQNRGLHSLRRELLEQDKARMGTSIGQAQEYARIMNDPNVPEEQKAAITQYMQRNAKSGLGAVSYPKTEAQAALRELEDLKAQGVDITPALVDSTYRKWGAGQYAPARQSRGVLDNIKDILIPRVNDYISNGMMPEEAIRTVEEEAGVPEGYLTRTSNYTPQSIKEAGDKSFETGLSSEYSKQVASTIEGAEQVALNIAKGTSALRIVEAHPELTGSGSIGEGIRKYARDFGLASEEANVLATLASDIKGTQIASVLETQNVGQVSNDERKEFAKQAINLGDDASAVKARLMLYILQNELAYDSYEKTIELMKKGYRGVDLMLAMNDYHKGRLEQTKARIQEITGTTGTVTAVDKKTGKELKLRRKQ